MEMVQLLTLNRLRCLLWLSCFCLVLNSESIVAKPVNTNQNPKNGLAPKEIHAVIKKNMEEINACYNSSVKVNPTVAGTIKTRFVISLEGSVSSVQITENSTQDAELAECFAHRILNWNFPKPRGKQPVTVNYPFVVQ